MQQDWPRVWAYDGRKNLYASELFLPQHETNYEVRKEVRALGILAKCHIFCHRICSSILCSSELQTTEHDLLSTDYSNVTCATMH